MELINNRNIIYGFLILVVSYFVLFNGLGTLPLQMWDESRNAVNALEMLLNGNFLIPFYEGKPEMWSTKPPLFIWTAVISMKIFGVNEFALRLPSALSALALVIYLYMFCKNYLQNNSIGFLACMVLLTSVGFIDYHVARNGDYDAMLTLFVFVFCTQLYLYMENGNNKNLYFAALCLSLAILTKGIAALLVGPGILVACLVTRKYRQAAFSVRTILVLLAAFIVALSYYMIREVFNDGYIKAVIVNEVTGRYGEVTETHAGPVWFYLKGFVRPNYTAWLAFLPVAFVVTRWSGNNKMKSLAQYVSIISLIFFVVISGSATKIPWYDAQLYPFWALLIGMFLWVLVKKMSMFTHSQWKNATVAALFCLAIFAIPAYLLSKTSIREKNVKLDPSLLYGPSFKDFYKTYPGSKKLFVYSNGYNSALKFYETKYRSEKKQIIVSDTDFFRKGDTILTCGYFNKDKLVNKYKVQTLQENGERYTMVVTGPLQNQDLTLQSGY